ncbi:DUF6624 domain-containing protein [Pedobacter sp.]|uniref:DUF6624 domain-containing protein n=1 Tax=Pedobacter sp. TaxID=1411316 RepID=UPI003D800073
MKKSGLVLIFLYYSIFAFGQGSSTQYENYINKAELLFVSKAYSASALAYSAAFKANGGLGSMPDRYNAACAWALAKEVDSAFYQLERVAKKAYYFNYLHLTEDINLKSLKSNKRWDSLIAIVKQNKDKLYPKLDLVLNERLELIFINDQKYRKQLNEAEKKYGWDAKQVKDILLLMNKTDSVNVTKISKVLDEHGWLGPEEVGVNGNHALFLVIQHADLKTQEKYLPLLLDAVNKGNAKPNQLALLTDRIAIRNGKKQVYGSQVSQNHDTQTYEISPLEDPDHVDERRAKVGLGPLSTYLSQWNIKWDAEVYKKASN